MSSPSVSVVIPVRDAAAVPLLLRGLPPVDEVVVVADAADDALLAAVRAACPAAVLIHPVRRGPGAALTAGLAAARGDILVALNSDGSADPGEIPRFVKALGRADVALGSRYRADGRDLTGGRFRRRANLVLAWLVGVLFGVRRSDPGFGFVALRREAAAALAFPDPAGRRPVWGDGPEIEALLMLRPVAAGLRLVEVGTTGYPRLRRAPEDRIRLRHWLKALRHERRRAVATTAPTLYASARSQTVAVKPSSQPNSTTGEFPRYTERPATLGEGLRAIQPEARGASPDGWFARAKPRGTWPADYQNSPATDHTGRPAADRRGGADRRAAANGPAATNGPAGADGRAAANGPAATNGPAGADGRAGVDGRAGADGRAGVDRQVGGQGRAGANRPCPEADDRQSRPAAEKNRPCPNADDRQERPVVPDGTDPGEQVPNRPRREVGLKRRRLEARDRPDLRVINGEGTGSRSRPPRLRAIPGEG